MRPSNSPEKKWRCGPFVDKVRSLRIDFVNITLKKVHWVLNGYGAGHILTLSLSSHLYPLFCYMFNNFDQINSVQGRVQQEIVGYTCVNTHIDGLNKTLEVVFSLYTGWKLFTYEELKNPSRRAAPPPNHFYFSFTYGNMICVSIGYSDLRWQ